MSEEPSFIVPVLAPPRTFWEKATLLHAAAHSNKPMERLSRHYYDVSRLYRLKGGEICADFALLAEVIRHKEFSFGQDLPAMIQPSRAHCGWFLVKIWRHIYVRTGVKCKMLFGTTPTFDDVLRDVQEIENLINEPKRSPQRPSVEKEGN